MTGGLRRFAEECYLDRISPALLSEFGRIDHSFKLFCNQANDLLRLGEPARLSRRSLLFTTARFLVSEWRDFLALFNAVADQDISPHLVHLVRLLTSLIGQLSEVRDVILAGVLQSHVSREGVARIKAMAVSLRAQAQGSVAAFDAQGFADAVVRLGRDVAAIFRRSVPKCTMGSGELVRLRTTVHAVCMELIRLADGAVAFPERMASVRFEVAQASRELDAVLGMVGLPVSIRLQFVSDGAHENSGES
jgi:hypothetical protein